MIICKKIIKFLWINRKETIEVIHILAAIATIIALGVAISTYNKARLIQEENEKIILENVLHEIESNLELIKVLENYEETLVNAPVFPLNRYNSFYLEKLLDFKIKKEDKIVIFRALEALKTTNKRMDRISGDFVYTYIDPVDFEFALNQRNFEAAEIIELSKIEIKKDLNSINQTVTELLTK